VFERDGGLCRWCGAIGTEIHHTNGDSNDLGDLELLCHDCHSEETEANMVPITPDHERYEEILTREKELRSRIDATTPLRPCDDESIWKDFYPELLTEQRQLLKRIKEDVEGIAKGRDPIEEERIKDELNEYDDLKSRVAALEAEKEEQKERILTPEMQAQLDAIDEEYSKLTEPLEEAVSTIDRRIRERTKQYGSTVKGGGFMAIYSRHTKWDHDGLEGYAKIHPEILQFRQEDKSFVSIRAVKKRKV
jgi:hypothetical protein